MRLDHHPRTRARKDGEAAMRRVGSSLVAVLFLAVAAFSPATATTRKGSTDKEETKMKNATAQLEPAQSAANEAIRPFRVSIPEDELVDLRRRIAATRLPEKE